MSSPTTTGGTGSGRRRGGTKFAAEDQALDQIAREAEQRLAARRAARAEAREIRMRELEKQQKQAEETQDRRYELTKTDRTTPTVRPYVSSSRRGSDDSGDGDTREMRKEIAELEEKWKKAMMNNAQLDNEKQTYRYQVDMLKDTLEEMEEQLIELQREHKDRCRELEAGKRNYKDLNLECTWLKEQLQLRDKLIEENGLVFVSDEPVDEESPKKGEDKKGNTDAALVTPDAANILALAEGSLDDRLKKFLSEKEQLEEEVRKLKQQLEEERERGALAEKYASPKLSRGSNGPDMQLLEVQMLSAEGFSAVEAQRQLNDYKFKLKKCEQDITQLEGNVIRLESQVKRYKAAAENSEKVEEELKLEKRKLQRELRETQMTAEELQTANHHLQKRLEKIKSTRNALNKPYMYGKMIAYIDSLLEHDDHSAGISSPSKSRRVVADIEQRREERREREKRGAEKESRDKERESKEKEWEARDKEREKQSDGKARHDKES